MVDTGYIDRFLQMAEDHQVDISVGGDGKVHLRSDGADPKQYERIKKLLNNMGRQNPALVKTRIQVFSGNIPDRVVPDKDETTLDKVGNTLDSIYPSSAAGKGAEGALLAGDLFAPELSVPAQVMLGIYGGLGGGMAGKESFASSIATGAFLGSVPGLAGKSVGLPSKAIKFFQRPGKQEAPALTAALGKEMAQHLQEIAPNTSKRILTTISDFGKPGKNTIKRVLNSSEMDAEVKGSYQKMIDGAVKACEDDANARLDFVKQSFKTRFKNLKGDALKQNRAAQQALKEIQEEAKYARSIGKEVRGYFNSVGRAGAAASQDTGALKTTLTAWDSRTGKGKAISKLTDALDYADPTGALTRMVRTVRDDYGKYSGFRRLVNLKGGMDESGTWFDPAVLQKHLDGQTNPAIRFVQRSLKDAFDPIRKIVRQNAPEFLSETMGKSVRPAVSDQPWGFLGKARMGERVPGLRGYVSRAIPHPEAFKTRIGTPPPLPAGAASNLPAILRAPLGAIFGGSDQNAAQ